MAASSMVELFKMHPDLAAYPFLSNFQASKEKELACLEKSGFAIKIKVCRLGNLTMFGDLEMW